MEMVETHLLFATLLLPYAILLFMACASRIRAWSSFDRAFDRINWGLTPNATGPFRRHLPVKIRYDAA